MSGELHRPYRLKTHRCMSDMIVTTSRETPSGADYFPLDSGGE